ncbi:MAG: hypothetical protein MJ108_09235 [Saccharofermentans sp.]|nr:hypothetical protein [Saccharofermentans sp.]
MKKLIAVLLVFVLIFSFVGCGKKEISNESPETTVETTLSKEQIIDQATTLSISSFISKANNNIVDAEKQYEGNYYTVTGYIYSIGKGSVMLSAPGVTESIYVYLSEDDISGLNQNQFITVVGQMTSVSEKKLENAYLVDKNFTISAKVEIIISFGDRNSTSFFGELISRTYNCRIQFLEHELASRYISSEKSKVKYGLNGVNYKEGDNITISGKAYYKGWDSSLKVGIIEFSVSPTITAN